MIFIETLQKMTRFGISNHVLDRPFPKGKNKKGN